MEEHEGSALLPSGPAAPAAHAAPEESRRLPAGSSAFGSDTDAQQSTPQQPALQQLTAQQQPSHQRPPQTHQQTSSNDTSASTLQSTQVSSSASTHDTNHTNSSSNSSSVPSNASNHISSSNSSSSSRILFLVVTSGAEESDRGSETTMPRGARYTRDSTRSLLQLLGIKPRIAYKILNAVFAGVEAVIAAGSRQRGQARRAYSVHRHGDGLCVGLTRADFAALVSSCAAQFGYRISSTSDELKVACGLRERRRCVIALLAGTSGSGKSTLASILAMRLGITTVVSTDSLRHMLRSFQGREEAPLLWASTYQAGEVLEGQGLGLSDSERLLAGYKAQCELLLEPLDRLIGHCIQRNQSLICEGVHLAVPFVLMLMQKYPSILPFLVYIKSEAKHTERMAVRAKYMTLDPHKNKYVKYMGNIRGIQDYLVRKCDKHLFPKIENSNIDRSVGVIHLTIMGCLRRAMKGEPALDSATNTARMPHSEYCTVLDSLASSSSALKAAGNHVGGGAGASDVSGSFASASGSFASASGGFASRGGGSFARMSDLSAGSFPGVSGFSSVGVPASGGSGSTGGSSTRAAWQMWLNATTADGAADAGAAAFGSQQQQQQRQQQQQQLGSSTAAGCSSSSDAHVTLTFAPAALGAPQPIASGSGASGSRQQRQGLWSAGEAAGTDVLPFQLLPSISGPRNSSPGAGDDWLTEPSSPLAAAGLRMKTQHRHDHQHEAAPFEHSNGSEFMLYPAGQLLSSDDEAADGASPRGSSADGSEDGNTFIQEYGSVAESTTADEWDDGEDGHGLRAWNGGMARALWGAPSWRRLPSRAPSLGAPTLGSGLYNSNVSAGLRRLSSGRSQHRGEVPLPYSERAATAEAAGSGRSSQQEQ